MTRVISKPINQTSYKVNPIVAKKALDRGLTLAFIGDANWDLYVNDAGRVYSLSKDGCNKGDTGYGDRNYIRRVMSKGWFTGETPTDRGLELLQGLNSVLLPRSNYLAFYTEEPAQLNQLTIN